LRRIGGVCPKSASICLPDRQVAQKESRLLKKDRLRSAFLAHKVSPLWILDANYPLTRENSPPYTPKRQKQCLINSIGALSTSIICYFLYKEEKKKTLALMHEIFPDA